MKTLARLVRLAAFALPALYCGIAQATMVPVPDEDMREVTGQALFVGDVIEPSGSGTGATTRDFRYYRMGLDVDLAMNANIDKLQLGCGGYNESILANACDIDLDYVSFMGRSGDAAGAAGTSDLVLRRPYIEIATVGSGATREVVGIKIGAQSADGYMSIGRKYTNGSVNQERGGTCNSLDTSAGGAGRLACHSGVNTLSGYVNLHVTGGVYGCASLLGVVCWNGGSPPDKEYIGNFDTTVTVAGTRMTSTVMSPTINSFLAGIQISATVTEDTRFIHGTLMKNTQDFFISFQRQRVEYPKYDKTSYSPVANAGWWMNLPQVEMLNLRAESPNNWDSVVGSLVGLSMQNINMDLAPQDNCFGSLVFC